MINQLYELLRKKRKELESKYYSKSFDTHSLVEFSVGTSTIRAFRKSDKHVKKYQPLSLYRVWALGYLESNIFKEQINSQNNFEVFRLNALNNLMLYWKNTDGGKPEFYKFNKLVDLLFKFLPLWDTDTLDKQKKEWIFKNTNVPLDKFSLELLDKYHTKIKIKKPISMNSVTNEQSYDTFQLAIKEVCGDLPVILFDLYAWDKPHEFKLIPLDEN